MGSKYTPERSAARSDPYKRGKDDHRGRPTAEMQLEYAAEETVKRMNRDGPGSMSWYLTTGCITAKPIKNKRKTAVANLAQGNGYFRFACSPMLKVNTI
jgi:hypothetical protein